MKHLLVTYHKEYNAYSILYNHGKMIVIHNSKARNLQYILSNLNPHWRATIKWINDNQNEIEIIYQLERR